jgi:hypothetical protein
VLPATRGVEGDPDYLRGFLPGTDGYSSECLHLCRRLDWRFLLPQCCLGDVLYFGPPKGILISALRRFSRSVTVLDPAPRAASLAPSFDLAVLTSPVHAAFVQSYHLLRNTGSLYAEVKNPRFWHWRMLDNRTDLRRIGFLNVSAFWHRPDFELCREIIPLDNTAAAIQYFSRRSDSLASRMKAAAVRGGIKAGLLGQTVACVSITAQKAETR